VDDQQLAFTLLIAGALLVLALGAVAEGVGWWNRENSPFNYWSTIAPMAMFVFVGVYRLIIG